MAHSCQDAFELASIHVGVVSGHGLALAEAGHDVQIFLTHDATYLMRKATVEAVKPVGWPPLSETLAKG